MGEVHCDGRRRAHCKQAFLELAVDCARLRLCSCQRRARYAGYSVPIPPMENPTTATAFRAPKLHLKTASSRWWFADRLRPDSGWRSGDRDRAQSDPPKAQVMENLAMYQQLLRLTLIGV